MEILTWTYILVGLSFALYIGIAIYTRAGSTKEFYTAGGGVSPLANGMATAADWMSAASFISMAGLISFSGSCCDMCAVYLLYLRCWSNAWCRHCILSLLRSSYRVGRSHRNVYRVFLCCFGWNERNHLHSSGSILRAYFRFHGSCHICFYAIDWKSYSTVGSGKHSS